MGVIFEIYHMVNAYELHVAGTPIPVEIPIVETGGAPQMRGSGGCDSGFGQVLLRCLSESVLWKAQPPIWPIKILNCTHARTMYSCEYFKPLSTWPFTFDYSLAVENKQRHVATEEQDRD